jgi:hypothetical protein
MPAPQKWPLNRIGGIGIEGGEREREREREGERLIYGIVTEDLGCSGLCWWLL